MADTYDPQVLERSGLVFTVHPDSGCWEWAACIQSNGYGRVRLNGKTQLAHRVAYRAYLPLGDEESLDHLCRNRRCINPAHLEIVTRAQNCRRGSRSRLTFAQVEEIRGLAEAKDQTWAQIAARFGISVSNVSLIVSRRRWNVDSEAEAYGGAA